MVQALGLRQGQAVWRRLGLLSHTHSSNVLNVALLADVVYVVFEDFHARYSAIPTSCISYQHMRVIQRIYHTQDTCHKQY